MFNVLFTFAALTQVQTNQTIAAIAFQMHNPRTRAQTKFISTAVTKTVIIALSLSLVQFLTHSAECLCLCLLWTQRNKTKTYQNQFIWNRSRTISMCDRTQSEKSAFSAMAIELIKSLQNILFPHFIWLSVSTSPSIHPIAHSLLFAFIAFA